MNQLSMGLGGFLLVLGLCLAFNAGTFASLLRAGAPLSSVNFYYEGILLLLVGTFVASFGGALLAWGVAEKENPSTAAVA